MSANGRWLVAGDQVGAPGPQPEPQRTGRIAAAKLKIDQTRSNVVASRSKHFTVDVALDLSVRDMSTGGAVLAGAIAFRVFLWTLPASLLVVGLLGFNSDDAKSGAKGFGLGGVTADAVSTAAAEAHRARWALVIIGAVLLVSVSRTLGVTVFTSVALTWQLSVRKPASYLVTAGVTAALMLGIAAISAACAWLRHHSPGVGLAASIVVIVIWTASWWGISSLLPHPPLPWWGLLPGACLVGIGMEIMHLIVVLYLAPRVSSSSALYGSLGAAATLLLGAYLIARIILASAGLNATIHTKRSLESRQIGT